jgi:hypothetical protein
MAMTAYLPFVLKFIVVLPFFGAPDGPTTPDFLDFSPGNRGRKRPTSNNGGHIDFPSLMVKYWGQELLLKFFFPLRNNDLMHHATYSEVQDTGSSNRPKRGKRSACPT